MKISVNVQGKNFDVEIIDPLARPVVAYVEGERFEIWPEEENRRGYGFAGFSRIEEKTGNGNGKNGTQSTIHSEETRIAAGFSRIADMPGNGNGKKIGNGNGNWTINKNGNESHHNGYAKNNGNGHNGTKPIHAPIPGTIRSVDVSPGDHVNPGQQLCVLEAMKMYNSIRATRAGVVAAVHVTPGEHVVRNEVLVVVSDGVF